MAIVEECVRPLRNGDKLSREEFLRIWEAHPGIKRAELIGGVVYMPSPLSFSHGNEDFEVGGWMYYYSVHTAGTAGCFNTTSFILDDVPQPDVNLLILPEFGGGSWIEKGYVAGVPEMLTEVCLSSVDYDLHEEIGIVPDREDSGVPGHPRSGPGNPLAYP